MLFKGTKEDKTEGKQLGDALSCYYSGNEQTGYKGYVQQVVSNADKYASVKFHLSSQSKRIE